MLSVTTAAVHRSMRPKTPESSSSPSPSPSPPPNQERGRNQGWNCEYAIISKRSYRPSIARKKIILSDPTTIGGDLHCRSVPVGHVDSPIFEVKFEARARDASPGEERRSHPVRFLKSSQMQERTKVARERDDSTERSDLESPEHKKKIMRIEEAEEAKEVEKKCLGDDEEEEPKPKETKVPVSSRMANALNFLEKKKNCMDEATISEIPGIPGIPGAPIEESEEALEDFNRPILGEECWETDRNISRETIFERPEENACCNVENEDSYYAMGFPNPPGENRCWLNATLHALFSLPLIEHLEKLDSHELRACTQLTKTFLALRLFWEKGSTEKAKTYQTIKLFKENLGILDESYPSYRQQDVSEFLTMFLNYLKTDFEKLIANRKSGEMENAKENNQENICYRSPPQTPSKRLPLTDISVSKRKSNESSECSPKKNRLDNGLVYNSRDLMSPRSNGRSNDPAYNVHTPPHNRDKKLIGARDEDLNPPSNPIDRYFLLHMMEHYVCSGCSKHRQRKVDNLMIYVDLMSGSEHQVVCLDKLIKATREPEERTLTCAKCKYDKHKVFTTYRHCPKILMVQINRYGMCSDGSVAKFNTPVEIPETLQLDLGASDVENGNARPENFEPVAVIAHVGSAMDCGHYTSYVKHEDSWYHYNDLNVTEMWGNEALHAAQTTAYVVFFASTKL